MAFNNCCQSAIADHGGTWLLKAGCIRAAVNGCIIGVIKGDTRSLDHGSYQGHVNEVPKFKWYQVRTYESHERLGVWVSL